MQHSVKDCVVLCCFAASLLHHLPSRWVDECIAEASADVHSTSFALDQPRCEEVGDDAILDSKKVELLDSLQTKRSWEMELVARVRHTAFTHTCACQVTA